MEVLKMYFDKDINQCSPVTPDVARKERVDEDGNIYPVFEPVDYPSIQRSFGTVKDWSLEALLKAGINPNFPIHTGNSTRLEGLDVLSEFEALADDILVDETKTTE